MSIAKIRLFLGLLRRTPLQGWPAFIRNHLGKPSYAQWLRLHQQYGLKTAKTLGPTLAEKPDAPRFSILLPVCDPPLPWLKAAVASVQNQTYPNWELCIADDASASASVKDWLANLAQTDTRIKVQFRETRGHISAASNSALEQASADWLVLLDHDDYLSRDALFWLAQAIQKNAGWKIFYSDEDQIDEKDRHFCPFFKPDWSPHLALSQAYLGHLVCIKRDLVGNGFDSAYNGAQDYHLWLTASLHAGDAAICHIPRILYHWRVHQGSTAQGGDAKPYADDAGLRAAAAYCESRYANNQPTPKVIPGDYPLTYQLDFSEACAAQMASIIIPTRNQRQYLEPCIESIRRHAGPIRYEIIVVDNGSTEPDTLEYLETLKQSSDCQVCTDPRPFNWSAVNNLGATKAQGSVLVFLNNDIEVKTPNWLSALAGYALLPDVGVTGALLSYPDGTIQHSGVVIGMGGWADHVFRGDGAVHANPHNPFVSPLLTRNVMAVTGACMAVSRARFDELGGFNDTDFIICGSDIEFALRAKQVAGFNVLCAQAQLIHHESKSRSPEIPEQDFIGSRAAYGGYRTEWIDPYFNPNLSLLSTTPALSLEPPRPPAPNAAAI